jgi:predicted metal-dependent phosphoesterase TrpH
MRLALKEVEQLERKAREDAGLPVEAEEGTEMPPVVLPKFKEMQKHMRLERMEKRAKEKEVLEKKVDDLEAQIKEIQDRLKTLSNPEAYKENRRMLNNPAPNVVPMEEEEPQPVFDESKAAIGPSGEVLDFPEYDGSEQPRENKKTFAWFCNKNRKEVKAALNPEEGKNKEKVNAILKQRFIALSDEEKGTWRAWAAWDKKR